jgi:hypothetical protein
MTSARSMEAKLKAQSGVDEPLACTDCWALRRIYTGSMWPAFANCAVRPRKGCLTCHHHADREEAAQALKAKLEGRKRLSK